MTTTVNPFISTFGTIKNAQPLGKKMTSNDGGATWSYMNPFGRFITVGEVQIFDDFGSYHYELRFY